MPPVGAPNLPDKLLSSVGSATASLHHADYATFAKTIDSESVDLLVTSPPYFIGKEYDQSNSLSDFAKTIADLLPELPLNEDHRRLG